MKNKLFFLLISISIIFLSMSSCSKTMSKISSISSDEIVVYPSPPDTARFQYLTCINNSEDIVGKRTKFVEFVMGKKEVFNLTKPYGATFSKDKIFICDQGAGIIEMVDLEKGSFNVFAPTGLGQLVSPFNCAVDDSNNLYVADIKRNQIVVFNPEGKYLNAFGDTGIFKPVDVFIKDKKVWVVDIKSAQVSVYSTDFGNKFLYNLIGNDVAAKEKLYAPNDIFVTDSLVYVCDNGDYKVKSYTHQGKFIAAVGGLGTNLGQFSRPKGIAVDNDLNLFAVDGLFENVQIFNKNQELLMFFGGHYQAPGGLWLPATISIDYDNLKYFQKYVHHNFKLNYLVMVTNQYGPGKINIYGAVEPNK